MIRKKLLLLLLIFELLSVLFALNVSKESFLKYGSTDTVVYYIITNFGISTLDGENIFYKKALDLGFNTEKDSFLIGHQVYRFLPYLIVNTVSKYMYINPDLFIYFLNFVINLLIIIFLYKYFLFKNFDQKYLFVFLLTSIPYSFKMWLTVPYNLNYPLFVLIGIYSIYLFNKKYYFHTLVLILINIFIRQTSILIPLGILMYGVYIRSNNIIKISSVYLIFSFVLMYILDKVVYSFGFTMLTTESVTGILNINKKDDFFALLLMILKLIISIFPLIYLNLLNSNRINLSIYLIVGLLLIIQPIIGGKFTGMSISIVASLSIPFLLLSLPKNIFITIENSYKLNKFNIIILYSAFFLYSLHPSWDYISRFINMYQNFPYIYPSVLGFLLLIYLLLNKIYENKFANKY